MKVLTLAAKYKDYIAAFFLLLFILLYPSYDNVRFAPEYTYTDEIQYRTHIVESIVLEVIKAQEKEEALNYTQTCDNALSYIKEMNLKAEQESMTLSADQKVLNEAYQAYLKEAAKVITTCNTGQAPDLTAFNTTKAHFSDFYYSGYIEHRTYFVEMIVQEVIEAQEKEETWKYRQTCDDTLSDIQEMNLDAEQEYMTLSDDQKKINEAYRVYLKEAAKVVTNCYTARVQTSQQ